MALLGSAVSRIAVALLHLGAQEPLRVRVSALKGIVRIVRAAIALDIELLDLKSLRAACKGRRKADPKITTKAVIKPLATGTSALYLADYSRVEGQPLNLLSRQCTNPA